MIKKVISLALTAAVVAASVPMTAFGAISDLPGVEVVSIEDIPDILIGNYTDAKNATGTTAIICTNPDGAVGGVSVLGGSPATRETDLLDPTKTVQIVNAICLTGGSAFGLDAAGGIQQYLEEKGLGVPVGAVSYTHLDVYKRQL